MSAIYDRVDAGEISEDEADRLIAELTPRYEKANELTEKIARDINHQLRQYDQMFDSLDNAIGTEGYQKLAGEVESRNAQTRMSMTDEERRASLASETEDVAREDQIFLDRLVGNAEMGTRTDDKAAEIKEALKDKELTADQKAVVDVYTGDSKKAVLEIDREDGKRKIVVRQGSELGAGTKHSLYRHYGAKNSYIVAEDIPLIHEVLSSGERHVNEEKPNGVVYKKRINGVEYYVATKMKAGNGEEFTSFYTKRKPSDTIASSPEGNTPEGARMSVEDFDAAKVRNNSESQASSDEEIRFREDKEEDKTLVGVHNITEEKLQKALKLGGLANPSAAVIDITKGGHNSYGDISLVMPSSLVDKETGRNAGTWAADAYTPRFPSTRKRWETKSYYKFGKDVGVISPDDLKLVPEVLAKGDRVSKGRRGANMLEYTLNKDGVRYTVVTERKKGVEEFNDFYTNKKTQSSGTSRRAQSDANTPEGAHTDEDLGFDAAKVRNNSESQASSDEEIRFREDKDKFNAEHPDMSPVEYDWQRESGRQYDPEKGLSFRDATEQEDRINEEFNKQLQDQIDGKLPAGHIYQIGRPGAILRAAGFPDAPIELSATHLAKKASQSNHKFSLEDVKDLPLALRTPLAVFRYGDKSKAENVIVGIDRDGKQFVVGVHFNQNRNGVEVSSIRGLFNKENAEWLNWISQGKAEYLDKEKIQALIDKQQKNLADVEYLDLDYTAKLVKEFENPSLVDENSTNEILFREAGDADTEEVGAEQPDAEGADDAETLEPSEKEELRRMTIKEKVLKMATMLESILNLYPI